MRPPIYRLLDIPAVYNLAQEILAPGGRAHIDALITRLADAGDARPWLDVGCGPQTLVPLPEGGLCVLDRTASYVAAMRGRYRACVGDAALLPYAAGRFGAVWSTGLLHHLDDATARNALAEMVRVTAPQGRIHVLDAVLPEPAWRRPVAWAIRRLDRGRFMRREAAWRALLPAGAAWQVERQVYAGNGLELLLAVGTPR